MYRLCYVRHNVAYFTSIPVLKQWGDDWDDAPYEHNAGEPYNTPGDILLVRFDAENMVEAQYMRSSKSPISVEELNNGLSPWLTYYLFHMKIEVYAGITMGDFIKILIMLGKDFEVLPYPP